MQFIRPTVNVSAVVVVSLPCNDAKLHCSACNREVPPQMWTGPLKLFSLTHQADFAKGRKFRFTWLGKALGVVMLAGVLWLGWGLYEGYKSQTSGLIYQTSDATISRVLSAPKPGTILVISYTRPEDIRGSTAGSTEWLARVEAAENDTLTLRFHRAPPTERSARFAPTVSGTEDANFTGPQVVVRRTRNPADFRILSGVPTPPRHDLLSVYRIVRE